MTLKRSILLSILLGLSTESYLQASDVSDGSLLSNRATLSAALDDLDLGETLQVYTDNSLEGLTARLNGQRKVMLRDVGRVTGLNTYLLGLFRGFQEQGEFGEEKAQLPQLIANLAESQVLFIMNNQRSFEKAYNFNVATYGGVSYAAMLAWTQKDLDHFRKLRELRSNMAYNQAVIQSQEEALKAWVENMSAE